MAKRQMITLCQIGISDPAVEFEQAGFSPDGEPIVRKRTVRVPPLAFVELNEAEITELLALDAVREPTELELALGSPQEMEIVR